MLPQTDRFCSNPKNHHDENSHFVLLKADEALSDIKGLVIYMDVNVMILTRYLQGVHKTNTLRRNCACPFTSFISETGKHISVSPICTFNIMVYIQSSLEILL
jgi:hypothetical protein